MNADGSQPSRLTLDGPGERYFAPFSSDGQWIALQMTPVVGEVHSAVYVMRSDGTALRRVSETAFAA